MTDFTSWKPPLWTAGLNFDTINGGIMSGMIGTFRPRPKPPARSLDRLDPSVMRFVKLPRRTKKAWRKRTHGIRLSTRERARVSRIDRELNAPTLTRRLVASWFRVPAKLISPHRSAVGTRLKEERT